jgi:hypothetical protein
MALKIHVGGAESDSFITVAEADAYLEGLPDDLTAWENLSEEGKEFRLQLAVQLMGHLPLRGRTVYRNQKLCFPRTCQPLSQRNTIPDDAKRGQAYVAYSVIHRSLGSQPSVGEEMPSEWGRPSSISLAGLISVSFADRLEGGGNILTNLVRSLPFPVYQLMKPFLSQFRGGTVVAEEDMRTLSTTTTTTTVPGQTTTTTTA